MSSDETQQKGSVAVMVHNAGKFVKLGKFKALLASQGLEFEKLETNTSNGSLVVVFRSPAACAAGFEKLKSIPNYKGDPFKCSLLEEYEPKVRQEKPKTQKQEQPAARTPQTLLEATAPFWGNPEELLAKQKQVRNALHHQMTRLLAGQTLQSQFDQAKTHQLPKQMPKYFAKDEIRRRVLGIQEIFNGLVQQGYRTKGEFKIQRTEGRCAIGSFIRTESSKFRVFSAEEMLNEAKIFPKPILMLLQIFQDIFNGENATMRPKDRQFDPEVETNDLGFLQLKCSGHVNDRTFVVDQILAQLELSDPLDNFQGLCDAVKIKATSLPDFNNVKIQICVPGTDPEPFVEQFLHGLRFKITPSSFFQQNIEVFEALTSHVASFLAKEDAAAKRTVFDVCCGTGTLGQLTAARAHFSHIIGIDIVQEAVDAARLQFQQNAEKLPGVTAEYVCAPAEQRLDLFQNANPTDVAILDPPRSGLHRSVLKVIRESALQQLVYVSCNPKSLATDLYALCTIDCTWTKKEPHYGKPPFYVEHLQLFNMFPGCDHVETVAVLKRSVGQLGEVE